MQGGGGARSSGLGKQVRVGLFVVALDDSYSLEIVRGVLAAARDTNTQVIAAVGGMVEPPDSPDAMKNRVYDLFGPDQVDGLLVSAAGLSSRVGVAALEKWLSKLGLPVSCIGAKVTGLPSFV